MHARLALVLPLLTAACVEADLEIPADYAADVDAVSQYARSRGAMASPAALSLAGRLTGLKSETLGEPNLDTCVTWPTADDVEWLEGDSLDGWGYRIVLDECTLTGLGSFSGDVLVSFENLQSLGAAAAPWRVKLAATADWTAMALGQFDVYSETDLDGAAGGVLYLAGETHATWGSSVSSTYDLDVVSPLGGSIAGSHTGTTSRESTEDGTVLSHDGSSDVTITLPDGTAVTGSVDSTGLEQLRGDLYPYAGDIALTGNAGGTTTLTFSEDTPVTGAVEIELPDGTTRTIHLPV